MSKNIKIKNIIKTVFIILLCLFFINSTSFALISEGTFYDRKNLQVQSAFNPILKEVGNVRETEALVELMYIRQMLLRDKYVQVHDMNARLAEWYSEASVRGMGKERIFKVSYSAIPGSDGSRTVVLEFLKEEEKTKRFLIEVSDITLTVQKIEYDNAVLIKSLDEGDLNGGIGGFLKDLGYEAKFNNVIRRSIDDTWLSFLKIKLIELAIKKGYKNVSAREIKSMVSGGMEEGNGVISDIAAMLLTAFSEKVPGIDYDYVSGILNEIFDGLKDTKPLQAAEIVLLASGAGFDTGEKGYAESVINRTMFYSDALYSPDSKLNLTSLALFKQYDRVSMSDADVAVRSLGGSVTTLINIVEKYGSNDNVRKMLSPDIREVIEKSRDPIGAAKLAVLAKKNNIGEIDDGYLTAFFSDKFSMLNMAAPDKRTYTPKAIELLLLARKAGIKIGLEGIAVRGMRSLSGVSAVDAGRLSVMAFEQGMEGISFFDIKDNFDVCLERGNLENAMQIAVDAAGMDTIKLAPDNIMYFIEKSFAYDLPYYAGRIALLYKERSMTENADLMFADKEKEVRRFFNEHNMRLIMENHFMAKKFLFMPPDKKLSRLEELNDFIDIVKTKNNLLPPEKRIPENEIDHDYRALAYILDETVPGTLTYLVEMIDRTNNPHNVKRFFDRKREVLLDSVLIERIGGIVELQKEIKSRLRRTRGGVDITGIFNIIDISNSYIETGARDVIVSILGSFIRENDMDKGITRDLRAFISENRVNKLYLALAAKLLEIMSGFLEIKDIKVNQKAYQKIYFPFFFRLKIAMKYLSAHFPEKIPVFKGLIGALLENRVWDFLENEGQKDPMGVEIAQHNNIVRKDMQALGIDTDKWLGRKEKERLERRVFVCEEKEEKYTFEVRMIERNPGHDLFIGDFTDCCLAMNSNDHTDAIIDRLIDEGLNVIEVVDRKTGKTMAALWVYIDEAGYLVIQNIEIRAMYEKTGNLKDTVGHSMIAYAVDVADKIGAKGLLIGMPGHGKYFGEDGRTGFVEENFGSEKTSYGREKIGGYIYGKKYYLDTAGKPEAYVVWERGKENPYVYEKKAFILKKLKDKTIGPAGEGPEDDPADRGIERRRKIEERKMESIADNSVRLISVVEKIYDSSIQASDAGNNTAKVDVVVDLSLLARKDLEENIETWAYLILSSSRKMDIIFRFESPGYVSSGNPVPEDMISQSVFFKALRRKIEEAAYTLSIDIDTGTFFDEHINVAKRPEAKEILLWSREWFEGQVELAPEQYPVLISGASETIGGIAFRNFEAALAIGLSEAVLAIIKEQDSIRGTSKAVYPEARKRLIPMLQRVYDIFSYDITKDKNEKIIIDEKTIDDMIHDKTAVRLSIAMDLALPAMVRRSYRMLRTLHDGVQMALHAA